MPGHAFGPVDHLLHTPTGSIADVVLATSALQCPQGPDMRLGQIGHMNIIAHTGAVRCRIIVAKDDYLRPLLKRHLQDARDQMALRRMVFSIFFGCARRVEVSQCDVAQSVDSIEPLEHPLDDIFHLAVGAAGSDRLLLGNGNPFRSAEEIGRRRKNHSLHIVFDHALQEIQPAPNATTKIYKRFLHRFADQRRSGEVHDGIGAMVRKGQVDAGAIGEVSLYKNRFRMDRGPMPLRQIVEHNHRHSFGDELRNDDAPNVARSTGDENFHDDLRLRI